MNEASLNGTHPALIAGLACNSDVQLPYRLPVCKVTHSSLCEEPCVEDVLSDNVIVRSAQLAQDAQVGYCTDYANKRQPSGFNEIKEAMKGH
eukprot:248369-Heterocapsa_arctica.AAC.1